MIQKLLLALHFGFLLERLMYFQSVVLGWCMDSSGGIPLLRRLLVQLLHDDVIVMAL